MADPQPQPAEGEAPAGDAPEAKDSGSDANGYPQQRPLRALILILLASFCFASVTASIKAIGEHVGWATPICARGVVGTLACLIWLRVRGQKLRPKGWGMLALRCGAGLTAMGCYYWAVIPGRGNTDLTTAAMLLKTAPLWVAVLSPLVVKETPGRRIWIALAVGLLGCGLRYGFALEGEETGVIMSLIAGLLAALAYLALRALSKTDDALTIVTVFSIALLLVPLPFMGEAFASYAEWPAKTWILLGAIGVSGTFGQLFLTAAYRSASAAAATVAGVGEIAMALGYSVLVFDETVTTIAMIGGALAVGAGFIATGGQADPKD